MPNRRRCDCLSRTQHVPACVALSAHENQWHAARATGSRAHVKLMSTCAKHKHPCMLTRTPTQRSIPTHVHAPSHACHHARKHAQATTHLHIYRQARTNTHAPANFGPEIFMQTKEYLRTQTQGQRQKLAVTWSTPQSPLCTAIGPSFSQGKPGFAPNQCRSSSVELNSKDT